MQHVFKLTALAALLAVASVSAHAELATDANLELDTTKFNAANGRDSDLTMGGRVEFNLSSKATNGDGFVAARASLLLKKDGESGVDDMWVQFGTSAVDFKLGRFEAMDLFPLGKDVVVDEVAGTYRTNALRGRFGKDFFHGAVGANAGALRFELGLVKAKEDGDVEGIRPAVTYTSGPLSIRAGAESVKVVGTSGTQTGMGVSVGYAFAQDGNVNVNFSKKKDDKTFGANLVYGPAGIGFISGKGATDASKSNTLYVAYALPLFGVKGATITPALSVSKGGAGTDRQIALRARINYAF